MVKPIQIITAILISAVALILIIFASVLILSKMGIDMQNVCQEQFKDCVNHNGSLSYTECNCRPYFFSSDDCHKCYESAGDWCSYPNGSSIKCEINLSD